MIKTIRKILAILTPAERARGAIVAGLMAVMAAIEVAGIVSIAPFLTVLGNPGMITTNRWIARLYDGLGFTDPHDFIVALGIFSFAMLVFSSCFRAFTNYVQFHYANMRRHSISMRLLKKYIQQPYPFFLRRNSSELSQITLSEVDHMINHAVIPLLQMIAYGFVSIATIGLLVAVDPFLALMMAGSLGVLYAALYFSIRRLLGRIGIERKVADRERYRTAQELLGGIKELKVLGRVDAYQDAFSVPSRRFSSCYTIAQTLSFIPKYIFEAIGFCAVIVVSLYTLNRQENFGDALPVIGLYSYAGYRLLPAIQNIYSSLAKLKFSEASIDSVLRDITATTPPDPPADAAARLRLERDMRLEHICFRYPGAKTQTLQDIDLVMPARTSTGIIGTTGAGKSTLVDLILGLLQPDSGRILIDGIPLTADNARSWQNNIGYVPQHIFLADDTVARNIAFGLPASDIDRAAVEHAARMAQIHDFIVNDLPAGYDTTIGERGVRLSGGQRQRLGIARALYHNPDIIIFDEATSALDQETEAEVMKAIEGLSGEKTVIMIAHRTATMKKCDMIVELESGYIKESRDYLSRA